MTNHELELRRAARRLRKFIGVVEHHPNCSSRTAKIGRKAKCDCYAWGREEAWQALDLLESALLKGRG